MQQKRGNSRLVIFIMVIFGVIIGGGATLMMMEVPNPQQTIEKPLDAKAILGAAQ